MEVNDNALTIVKTLAEAGYIAYFAGGWVRDFLMGTPSSDIDIATNAPPEKVVALFPRTVEVGMRFGVVIVVMNSHQFEVSTFREDIDYHDGRRPAKIVLSTPEEDAQRRDFTINGMFYDPLKDKVFDFVQGQEDLKRGIIRTIGDPRERFREDRLRMIRAVRFSVRFGFAMDAETREAIKEQAHTLFPAVAIERVWQELTKMAANSFDQALIEMHRLGLLQVIFPTLQKLSVEDIFSRVSSFAHMPKQCPAILYVMELFPDASLERQKDVCTYLKVSNKNTQIVERVWEGRCLVENESDALQWAYFYAQQDAQLCLQVIAARHPQREVFLQYHYQQMRRLHTHVERLRHKRPLVTAALLEREGITRGKTMGILLKEAERISINGDLHEVDAVMTLLKGSSLWPKKS